jgi:hypothetical protein
VLYLQAKTNIIGMHPNRGRFAAELVRRAQAVGDDARFRTIGVWEFVGLTGEWSRVLALYEFTDGWAGVTDQIRATMQAPPPELAEIYRVADTMRSGGVDDILEPLPGSPDWTSMTEPDRGPLLVSEEITVPPGNETEYAAYALACFEAAAREHGWRLLGAFRHALTDNRVVMHWTATLDGYRSLMSSGALRQWHGRGRALHVTWQQELWTAAAGSRFAAPL